MYFHFTFISVLGQTFVKQISKLGWNIHKEIGKQYDIHPDTNIKRKYIDLIQVE